jgi:hypothetical protein
VSSVAVANPSGMKASHHCLGFAGTVHAAHVFVTDVKRVLVFDCVDGRCVRTPERGKLCSRCVCTHTFFAVSAYDIFAFLMRRGELCTRLVVRDLIWNDDCWRSTMDCRYIQSPFSKKN